MTPNATDNATVPHRFMHDLGSPAQIAEILTLSIILIVALSANIVAFTTIIRDRKLRRNPHNLLVLNLIVMDLGISVLSMTFSMISIFDGGWLLEAFPILCKINGFGASLCTIGNFATVLFISADRFLAVGWSARYPTTRKRVTVMIVIIWIISLLVGAAPLTERLSYYYYSSSTHHCSPAWTNCIFYVFNLTFVYGLAVPTMFISHAFIIYKLRAKEKKLRSYGVGKSGQANASHPEDHITTVSGSAGMGTDISMEGVTRSGIEEQEHSLHSLSVDFGDTSDTVGTSEIDLSSSDMVFRAQKKEGRPRKAKGKRDKQTQLAVKWANLSVDKQVAVAGGMVVLTTTVCWAPYSLVHACFFDFTPSHMVGVATMWLGYTNAMLDPLIYAFFNRQIRSKIVNRFNDCFSCLK